MLLLTKVLFFVATFGINFSSPLENDPNAEDELPLLPYSEQELIELLSSFVPVFEKGENESTLEKRNAFEIDSAIKHS